MLGVVGLILTMQSSSNLAAAYGIAVTGTMSIDTILAFVVATSIWRWNPILSALVALGFLAIDLAFFTGNVPKIPDGGWFPLIIGSLVFVVMSTWKSGRTILQEKLQEMAMPMESLHQLLQDNPPVRVKGTAVFLTTNHAGIPLSLQSNLRHNHAMHENVIILSVLTEPIPRVPPEKRRVVVNLAESIFRITLHYGFAESPNIPKALRSSSRAIDVDPADTFYFLSRESLICQSSKMAAWRMKLFTIMARNAGSAARYFGIPSEKVVELGMQVII